MQLSPLKKLTRRTRAGAIASRVAAEQLSQARDKLGLRKRLMGATHRVFSTQQSLDYIDVVYGDYLEHGQLGPQRLRGVSVLELGPGDNLGVATRFVADGAERVVALDRFATWRDPGQQREIYSALAARTNAEQRQRLRSTLAENGDLDLGGGKVEPLEGVTIEEAPRALAGQRFELIVSRAVLEHVVDLEAAFAAMDELLTDDGILVHKVDLRDHLIFSGGGQHPLTFLTVSDRSWALMGASQGIPNRRRIGFYKEIVSSLGYRGRYYIAGLAGLEQELKPALESPDPAAMASATRLADEIRPRLHPRWRELPGEELAVTDFFLVARRRA